MAHVVKIGFSDRMPAFEWDEEPEPMASFGFSFGRRIDDLSIFPKSATQKDTKKICDVFSMPALNCVNARFRDLVEEFEPGVHQFIPISLKRKDGTPIEGEYFIFNCCQLLGAVLVNETKCGEWRKVVAGPNEGQPYYDIPPHDLVLSRPAIGGKHIWVSAVANPGNPFFSDELVERMEQEKIRYVTINSKNEEIEKPWIPEDNIAPRIAWERQQPGERITLTFLNIEK